MAELFLVPDNNRPTPEYDGSIVEQAGACEADEFLRRKFGESALAIMSREILVFDHAYDDSALAIDHEKHTVAGVYLGLEEVTLRRPKRGTLGVAERAVAATFASSHGLPEISDELCNSMQKNDTCDASLYAKIGVLLDQEVRFGALQDNSRMATDDEKPDLYVVQ